MAEERRKGPPERRRSRTAAKAGDGDKPDVTAARGTPDDGEQRPSSPNDASSRADELDESIRAREKEDRGEVF